MLNTTFGKKPRGRGLFFILAAILIFQPRFSAGQRVSVAFWNVENLYDTIPSLFYDDSDYTPGGSRKWGAERYGRKIENLARVIDEMSADVLGLAEVENEAVVRDLVTALGTDYNYIHRTSGDRRGMDVAMLYKGDRFFPDPGPGGVRLERSGTGREFLCVRGELMGERIEFVVCHMASNLNGYAHRRRGMESLRALLERLMEDDPAANVVVMGDMNAVPDERVVAATLGRLDSPFGFVCCPHWEAYRAGKGTYRYRDRWFLYDWMAVSPSLARGTGMKAADAGIFVREWMTQPASPGAAASKKPFRTFYGREYLGGYSDHFPAVLLIVK